LQVYDQVLEQGTDLCSEEFVLSIFDHFQDGACVAFDQFVMSFAERFAGCLGNKSAGFLDFGARGLALFAALGSGLFQLFFFDGLLPFLSLLRRFGYLFLNLSFMFFLL
jgi:hypothetical protein